MGLEQPPPPYPEIENNPQLIVASLNRIYPDLVNLDKNEEDLLNGL